MKMNIKTGRQIIRVLGFLAILLWCLPSLTAADTRKSNTVAVLDFSVTAADGNQWGWAEGGVADLLQIELQQQGLFLLDRDAIHAVLAEQRLAASSLTAENSLAVAKLLNAQFLISGKVIPLAGECFRVEASVFSVETVETAVSAVGEGNFPKDFSQVVQQVANQITKKLPAHSGLAHETRPATRAPKPEALIMFYRGLNTCVVGHPEWGAGYFINAASLDPDFTVPLLWEIKAYEMAGLPELAHLRRKELAPILGLQGSNTDTVQITSTPNQPVQLVLVLALLDPVISVPIESLGPATIADSLKQSLLADKRVRVFAYEGIGAAVAEQDLSLSSLFASQNAPRYGRWLTADALLFCHVKPAESGRVEIELSLINPVNASVMARIQRIERPAALPKNIQSLTRELLTMWLAQPKATPYTMPNLEVSTTKAEGEYPDLRPIYRELARALGVAQREPDKSDSHRSLANAFGATARPRLAAYEIEQCLKRLDIHALHADTTYLGTHRWLFWEPSPASGAAGLVDPAAITNLIGRLLAVYPQSLAAGCMRYNLAVTAWQGKDWPETVSEARQARQIIQSWITQKASKSQTGIDSGAMPCELEMVAATYFLEGSSLGQSGQTEEARQVFHQGLNFMQASHVRNFCLPLGPYIGDSFGPEEVYGYGGDSPGIQTRLEQELVKLGETIVRPPQPSPPPAAVTKGPGADWIQKGQLESQNGNYLTALECYQKAVAAGAVITAGSSLAAALLEIALDRNLEQPQAEIEKLRRELGFPPVQASWVEWFAAGRKYQSGRQFNFEKAAASYRGALDFLEHPEKMGIYHLEKEPCCDRWNLRWGPTIGEVDLLWTRNYDRRWYSAAFYLAQCLIKLDKKEEAAQWLRQIALKVGGDSAIPLLERDAWNSSGWSSDDLGVRAAELLQTLHQDKGRLKFGQSDGPFKLPPMLIKARPVPAPDLPPVDDQVLQTLTNALDETAKESRPQKQHQHLQPVVEQYGHGLVPAGLKLLTGDGERRNESSLVWVLEQTSTAADAPWVVSTCTRHWRLIPLAEKLDPNATAIALADLWQEYAGKQFVPPGLIHEILRGRVRPLYSLVLEQVAEKKINHHVNVFEMDKAVSEEKSDELEAAFCEALARCLQLKIKQQDNYELRRISQVALRYGVSEGINGLWIADGADPEKLRADLGAVIDLPSKNDEVVAFLIANPPHWDWNPQQKKFQQSPQKDGP